MKQAKPLLTIKQKCSCKCYYCNQRDMHSECKKDNFNSCSGTGEQESNIYALRDFEECNPKNHHGWECSKCNCNGYKIPFKDYEIKTILDLDLELDFDNRNKLKDIRRKYKFKEDDKVVITNEH